MTSAWWLVAGYGAQSLGELLISALSFSMISQLVAERSRGIIMGAWFLGMGLSLYAGNGDSAPGTCLDTYIPVEVYTFPWNQPSPSLPSRAAVPS